MFKSFLSSVLVLSFIIGCSGTPASQAKPQIEELTLEGHEWKLVSFGRTRMAVPKKAWVSFSEGNYRGYAGCNGMGGEYVKEGNKLLLKPGFSTMMACPDMRLETKFRQTMDSVTGYRIENNKILLLLNKETPVLNFMLK